MTKPTTRPPLPQVPDHTHHYVNMLLPFFGAVFGLTLCVFVWNRGVEGLPTVPLFFGGWLVGLLLPRLYNQRYRVVGFIPYTTTVALVIVGIAELGLGWPNWLIGLFCLFEGFGVGAILRYRDRYRLEPLGFYTASLFGLATAVAVIGFFHSVGANSESLRLVYQLALLVVVGVLAVIAWVLFMRPAVEIFVEPFMRFQYTATMAGPGIPLVPITGPCLVIANHAAWFDPVFVAEIVPRATTPMMTAGFYDLPILGILMRRVFRVIRVAETSARRHAPEIQEAISALKQGRCVVIFPEGYLRRKEDQTLRRFGQGIWQILKACPDTPIVSCWIEGSWGCYFSHYNGPPTKNKKFDFRRPIQVGVSSPITIPPLLLTDHLVTRIYLMNCVLNARTHLGLPEVPRVEILTKEEEVV